MNVSVENLEHNLAKMTVEVEVERLDKAMNKVYNKQKNSISIPGFRKGKVPRPMIEKMYGKNVFLEDAVNDLIQEVYPEVYDEQEPIIKIMSAPSISVTKAEAGEPLVFEATVATKPPVKLGKYEKVKVTKVDISVKNDEVEAEIKRQLQSNARKVDVTDRAIQMDDDVNLDFDGYMNGVAFDGGKGENYDLKIGSHSFIDTFEDQLVGHNIGDEFDVEVTFPEDYHVDELAGNPAVFKVKINAIKEEVLPELDDEFVSDISEFEAVADFKKNIKERVKKQKEDSAKSAKENEAVETIAESSEMDIPDLMIDSQVDNMVREFANNIMMQGLSLEQYFQFTGQDADKMREQMRPDAIKRIKNSLVLEAIADEQNIEATEDDIMEEISAMAEAYGMEPEKVLETISNEEKESYRANIRNKKAIDYIMSKAVEKK